MPRFDVAEFNEIPELNKCPKCGAFFDGDVCPICKTVCPPEMMAGTRKKEKPDFVRPVRGASLTPFYLRWWFILIVAFFSRLIAIVLTWMTNWKTWVKTVITVALVLPYVASYFLYPLISNLFSQDRSEESARYEEASFVSVSISEGKRDSSDPLDLYDFI